MTARFYAFFLAKMNPDALHEASFDKAVTLSANC